MLYPSRAGDLQWQSGNPGSQHSSSAALFFGKHQIPQTCDHLINPIPAQKNTCVYIIIYTYVLIKCNPMWTRNPSTNPILNHSHEFQMIHERIEVVNLN